MPKPAQQNTLNVGNIKVTFLPDGYAYIDKFAMFPTSNEEGWNLHPEWVDDKGRVVASIGGFLVQTGGKNLIVDTGFGERNVDFPGFGPFVGGQFINNLAKTGLQPEDIDMVVYTHLHLDHIGWTSRTVNGDRKLTFSKADHLLMPNEWSFWHANGEGSGEHEHSHSHSHGQEDSHSHHESTLTKNDHGMLQNALGPGVEEVSAPLQNRTSFIKDGQEIAPGVNVMATPGHTPGHLSLVISSGNDRMIVLGDVMHCPAQFDEADWGVVFDVDPVLARQTREKLYAELEKPETVTADGHFGEAAFGRLMSAQGKKQWVQK